MLVVSKRIVNFGIEVEKTNIYNPVPTGWLSNYIYNGSYWFFSKKNNQMACIRKNYYLYSAVGMILKEKQTGR
ncbi:MAG: hypothetical protein EA411_10925 [Saprospirales bacterium]|nr:MAG: hypothetical protein EA411_10925 [Saprospirales bacterium]